MWLRVRDEVRRWKFHSEDEEKDYRIGRNRAARDRRENRVRLDWRTASEAGPYMASG
jgi:hypothetical protein